jgi:hypothetical protein
VAVLVGVDVWVGVEVRVGVEVGVKVGPPGVTVEVAVGVDVAVRLGVAVEVEVAVGVEVSVGPPGVIVGVGVTRAPTGKHCENSEVLLLGSVAVAVMTDPAETVTGSVTLNAALQVASVDGVAIPRNVIPSPKLFGTPALQEGLSKNSIR